VVIIGEDEAAQNKIMVKDMASGEQQVVGVGDFISQIT